MVPGAFLALVLVCLTQLIPGRPTLLPELLAACGLLLFILAGPRGLAIALPALMAFAHTERVIDDRLDAELAGQDVVLVGTVCEFPTSRPGVHRFIFEPERGSSTVIPKRIFLSWYEPEDTPAAGQRWQLKMRLKRPRSLSNPGTADFEHWAFVHNIGASGYVRSSVLNGRRPDRQYVCPVTRWRQGIAVLVENALAQRRAAGYLLAISLGVKNRLDESDWELLRRTGTVHLMAISGLHVGLVAALMLWFGRLVARLILLAGVQCTPLYWGRLMAVAGAVIYSGMAGFALPTVRALVMVLVVMVIAACRRRISGEQALAAALFAILLLMPSAPHQPGFWLSFYAVALLLLSGIELRGFGPVSPARLVNPAGKIRQLFRAQVILSVGLAPMAIFYFEQFPLIGLLANMLAVPAFALFIVPLSLVGLSAVMISPDIGAGILGSAAQIMEWILVYLRWLDSAPLSVWQPPPVTIAWVAMAIGTTLILIWPRPCRGRLMAVVLLIPLTRGMAPAPPAVLRVVVMDVGQGLAVLVQTTRHALVYDTGPVFRSGDSGQTVVLPVLRQFGIAHLDALFISHGDADHVGGASSILAAFPNAPVFAPERGRGWGRRYRRCVAGLSWAWDRVRFSVIHPGRGDEPQWSDNDGSCVLVIEAAGQRILLPGDIEAKAERVLVKNRLAQRAALVIAPHHGSNTSSIHSFVNATSPSFVVFAAGHQNRWGFPKAEVIERWQAVEACILRTAESGAMVFEVDAGGKFLLRSQHRLDTRRRWTEIEPGSRQRQCGTLSASSQRKRG